MKRIINYLLLVAAAASVFVAALLWVLAGTVDGLADFGWKYFLYIALGAPGLICLAAMAVNRVRMWGFIGFVAVTAVIVIAAVVGDLYAWIPLVVLLAAAIVLYITIFRLPKFDRGDNQKAGYKTYAERKAEATAKNEEEAKR